MSSENSHVHADAAVEDTEPTDERWALFDRRDFLMRSLEDAEREHAAGDLDERDLLRIRGRDESELAKLEASLAVRAAPALPAEIGSEVAGEEKSPVSGRRRRTWLVVVGTSAMVAGAALWVISATTTRLPGQGATGGITANGPAAIAEQLRQATALVTDGKTATALQIYDRVLSKDPHQVSALSSSGWIEWNVGIRSGSSSTEQAGRRAEEAAVRLTPRSYPAHFYLGSIELGDHDVAAGLDEYRAFLAEDPPTAWLTETASEIRKAFTDAGLAVPPGLPTS